MEKSVVYDHERPIGPLDEDTQAQVELLGGAVDYFGVGKRDLVDYSVPPGESVYIDDISGDPTAAAPANYSSLMVREDKIVAHGKKGTGTEDVAFQIVRNEGGDIVDIYRSATGESILREETNPYDGPLALNGLIRAFEIANRDEVHDRYSELLHPKTLHLKANSLEGGEVEATIFPTSIDFTVTKGFTTLGGMRNLEEVTEISLLESSLGDSGDDNYDSPRWMTVVFSINQRGQNRMFTTGVCDSGGEGPFVELEGGRDWLARIKEHVDKNQFGVEDGKDIVAVLDSAINSDGWYRYGC